MASKRCRRGPIILLTPGLPLRPGQTDYDTPHDWKRDDQMRPLVKPAGRDQAEAARRWFLDGACPSPLGGLHVWRTAEVCDVTILMLALQA